MIERKPVVPNNRPLSKLNQELQHGVAKAKKPSSRETPSIFTYVRRGKPMAGDVGGGNRVF